MDKNELKEKIPEHEDHNGVRLDAQAWYNIDMDVAWHFMGRWNRYQVIQISLLSVAILNLAYPVVSSMFTGKMIDFKCAVDNTSGVLESRYQRVDTCYIQVIDNISLMVISKDTCNKYEYEGGTTTLSYLAQWDLVCGKETLGQLPQILTMVGMAVGASTLPHLGDRFGRKILAIGTSVGLFATNLILAFVEHFEVFVLFKFFAGAFQQGSMTVIFTMMVEIMPLEYGTFVSALATVQWTISLCIVGLIGLIFQYHEWRTIQLTIALVILPTLICFCFVDESLRWLLGNSKVKEAEAIFRKVCRVNKKEYNKLMDTVLNGKKDEVELLSPPKENMIDDPTKELDDTYNVKVIIVNRNMRKITFVLCYTWMIAGMTYYGLTLLSTSLAGDPYVNYFLGSFVELPSAGFMYYSMQKYGRKRTVVVSNIISATALLLVIFVAHFAPILHGFIILQTCLTLIGKFFICSSFNSLWIYTPELYPTNLRNIGLGISSSAARVGASLSPLFTLLARKALWAPGALFATGCYISVLLLTMLPETRWRELPRNIEEIEQWFETDKQQDEKKSSRKEKA